jgi:outer membrane biosynthesis protein TonB
MKAKGLDGIVNVSGRIGAEGFLIHLTADGSQAFIPAALAAMRQWEWEPARLNGARIEVPFSLTIYFDIER